MEFLSRVPEVKDTVDKQSLLSHLCAYVVDRFNDSTDLFSEIPAVSRAAKVHVHCVRRGHLVFSLERNYVRTEAISVLVFR